MNPIVQNLVTELKSKQLKEWHPSELFDKLYAIIYIYEYTDTKEDKDVLNLLFNKGTEWLNNLKAGFQVSPAALTNIDKRRGK